MPHGILIVEFNARADGVIDLSSIRARVYRGRGGAGFSAPGAAAIALLYSQIQASRQARGELAANHYSEARPIALDGDADDLASRAGAMMLGKHTSRAERAALLTFAAPMSDREFRRCVEHDAALDVIGGVA